MAATSWGTLTRMEPRSWLLGNGDIIREPALEETSSGRKVRVAGTTNSVYSYSIEDMLFEAAQVHAREKKTWVHLEVTKPLNVILAGTLNYDPATTKAKLHLVHEATKHDAKTIVWWRFKDTKTPFEVLLTVQMGNVGGNRNAAGTQRLECFLTFPTRSYERSPFEGNDTKALNTHDPKFGSWIEAVGHLGHDHHTGWSDFARDSQPDWSDLLGEMDYAQLKDACTALMKLVRQVDDLDRIEVPDLGDPDSPSWRTLDLYDTNYNQTLAQDLADYLDGAPTIEKAADLYRELLGTLRSCGIVLDQSATNDFQAALLNGTKAVLGVRVFQLAGENHSIDNEHRLSMHLPTGTFVVECDRREVTKNEVAEKWDEAITVASLTGQQDVLMAFAQEYAKTHRKKRTAKIISERSK